MTSTYKTQQNVWIDIALSSDVEYAQPFNSIQLHANVTTPSGKNLCIPAFWRGGQEWVVRYSSDELGEHHYTTDCSDPNNLGLHQRIGTIDISAYDGENHLLKHGGIQVAEDKRHFSHQDGTPFFWLGDTWWMGLCDRISDDDFETLADQRAKQGFNVVQLVAGLFPDMPAFDPRGKNAGGFAWETEFSQINPAFYETADQRIQLLVSKGIVPCILGGWGYYMQWMGPEKMALHWRNIMARWGALPVVWISSGEQTMPWYLTPTHERLSTSANLMEQWSSLMQTMHAQNAFSRLISAHPITSARESVSDVALIDFEMQQTGHDQPAQHHANLALKGWHAKPTKPVMSGESCYEALEIIPTVNASQTRQAFWAHLIHSGFCGHTYGANGVWQINQLETPFGNSPTGNNWGTLPWQQAKDLPGATQLSMAKEWIETLPWSDLYTYTLVHRPSTRAHFLSKIPSTRLKNRLRKLLGTRINSPIAAAKTLDQQLAVYYTVTDQEFTLNTQPFKHGFTAYWFDPTSGERHNIDTRLVQDASTASFVPFGPNAAGDLDWVLILTGHKTL